MSGVDEDTAAANRYQAYLMGWRRGAAGGVVSAEKLAHPMLGATIATGLRDGRMAAATAARWAVREYGYRPSVTRGEVSES